MITLRPSGMKETTTCFPITGRLSIFKSLTKTEDDELGAARVPIRRLLLTGGTLDVELRRGGRPTGQYLSVSCIVLDHERDSTKK